MSLNKNQELDSWKVVLCSIRRIETTWRGLSLSRLDHLTYTEAILLWSMLLNDLSNQYRGLGNKRQHVGLAHDCVRVDVSELAAFLSDAIVLWRSCSSPSRSISTSSAFKRLLIKRHPFAGKLLSPITEAIDIYFNSPNPSHFFPVYQFLSFMNHLTLVDIDMSSQMEAEYIEQEELLAALHLPSFLISRLNEIMKEWFRDFSINEESFMPKHGPGGVAELPGDRSIVSKYQVTSPDDLIRYVFRKYAHLEIDSFCPLSGLPPTTRESVTIYVPKSMKTLRVISMEPTTLQYLQQGVDRCARTHISEHPHLRRHLDLNDQSVQRKSALKASKTRHFATVDLSAASDSVSYELVKKVFHGTPLYPFLVALRSRTSRLPSGRVVRLAKFAPMGSALTFPIESLIFACFAECTVRYVRHVTGVSYPEYHIYGDDIIIHEACLSDMVANLRLCGFRINEDKSYAGDHRFRESCGCDAYDGVDVTPLKIGRRFTARRVSPRTPGVFSALVDMANSSQVYNYELLRRYIINKLLDDKRYPPLFSGDVTSGVYSVWPDNHHLTERWNSGYQRFEVKAARPLSYTSCLDSKILWESSHKRFVDSGADVHDLARLRLFEQLRRTSVRRSTPNGSDHSLIDYIQEDGINWDHELHIGSAGTYLTKQWIEKPLFK